ncbi:ABC transporter family substrate-binding protein [Corynebacterium aquilae]|uniref:ABC transporter substrate-binding protein n=1 Tax=Corynebacterium aquilae DSM 44791 TaxID=1431546 RepID=A0A1L7CGM5_9CORY|nr:ABC transporter family substrate-binding protein [Corynebacterium aquilae]APT85012.1 ABC transporter substrate-binding protein [Corynebacterium aquilae DSM 44791]
MKTKKFALQMTSMVAATALLITGCASDSGSGGDSDKGDRQKVTDAKASDYLKAERDELKDGGQLVTALGEIPEQQNVFHADMVASTRVLWNWFNPQMIYFTPEGEPVNNPDYVTEMKADQKDGNTVVHYKLNDKATFNDGTPIDYKAFETTWKINNGKDDAFAVNSTDGYERITSVERGDSDKDVVVTFEGPYLYWPGLFNVIAHPAMGDAANFNDFVKKPHPEWGAGPFKLESMDFNRGEATFVRNENWWGEEGKLEKRIFRKLEPKAQINAFKNGEIDAVTATTKDNYAAVKDMTGVKVYSALDTRSGLLTMNSKAPNLSDAKVREAIAKTIDRDTLTNIVFNGLPYHGDPLNSMINFPYQKGYKDNFAEAVKYDPEEAKKLLDEAGWTEGGDGIRQKDGAPLTVRYVLFGDNETIAALAKANQKMLRDIGIDLQIDNRPASEFSKTVKNRDFDILPSAWGATDPYSVAFFGQMYNSNSTLNKSGTGTEELDKKIAEMAMMQDADKQMDRANELEKEAFQLYGIVPTYAPASIVALKDGISNYGATGFASFPVQNIGWKK